MRRHTSKNHRRAMSLQLCVRCPDARVWLDVPFVKQEKDGCGAASIAMVMQYGSATRPCRW